jgi:DNA-directed RNA polymerase specialized sigma24 family protein
MPSTDAPTMGRPAVGLSATAFEQLARERRGGLLRAARRATPRREEAEDAVQEALAIAYERRAQIRPDTAFAYIAVIARHEASRLRGDAEQCWSLDRPWPSAGDRPLVDHVRARELDLDGLLDALEALRALKRDEARAVMARALGWRYAEIAAAFAWSYTKTNRCVTEGSAAARRRARA